MTPRFQLQIFRYISLAKLCRPNTARTPEILLRPQANLCQTRDFTVIQKLVPIPPRDPAESIRYYGWKPKTRRKVTRRRYYEKDPKKDYLKINQTTKQNYIECTNDPVKMNAPTLVRPRRRFDASQMKWTLEDWPTDPECPDLSNDEAITDRKK